MIIHNQLETTRVNGPGVRACLWVQGCEINGAGKPGCLNCWNPATHDPNAAAGQEQTVFQLYSWLEYCYERHRIEGVTFSGGEPLQQALELRVLLDVLKESLPWLSVGIYSGYTEEELNKGRFGWYVWQEGRRVLDTSKEIWTPRQRAAVWKDLRKHLDFAVLGRYNALKPNGKPMLTSTNQELQLYSKRYRPSDFPAQAVEVHIRKKPGEVGNFVTITGFPTV